MSDELLNNIYEEYTYASVENGYDDDEVLVRARIERRRKKAQEIKRQRTKKLKYVKRCIALSVCAVAALTFVLVAISTGIRAISNNALSSITTNEVEEVAAAQNIEEETQPKKVYDYPVMSDSYVTITDSDIKSPYIALVSVEDSQIIAGRDATTKIYPASMTKVMTLLVAVESIEDLDSSSYTFKYGELNDLYIDDASVAGYLENETVTAREMLYGLILPSGADAAIGLANLVAGSEAEFAKLMNQKCEELGLKNTHFVNPSGLYDDNQYTTPVEMALIMIAAMDNPVCAEVLSTYQHTSAATALHPDGIELTSTMFSRMYGTEVEGVVIQAGKTGYVDESKHCLVNYAVKDGRHYVCVMAKAENKWHCIFDSFAIYRNYLP